MREQPHTLDPSGSTGVGLSWKTKGDIGNLEVVVVDVQVNALPIDISVVTIPQGDGPRSHRLDQRGVAP